MKKKRATLVFIALLGCGIVGASVGFAQGPTPPETPKTQPDKPQTPAPPAGGQIEDPNAPQRVPNAPLPVPKTPVPDPNKPIQDPTPSMPKAPAPAPQ